MEAEYIEDFEYAQLIIPQLNEECSFVGAFRIINDHVEIWLSYDWKEKDCKDISGMLERDERFTIYIKYKHSSVITCFDCYCFTPLVNIVIGEPKNESSWQGPPCPRGFFKFDSHNWIEDFYAYDKNRAYFTSFSLSFLNLEKWICTATSDKIRFKLNNGNQGTLSFLPSSNKILFHNEDALMSASTIAQYAFYLQILMRLITGIAIPPGELILNPDRYKGHKYHSNIGQNGIEPEKKDNEINRAERINISCKEMCNNNEIIKHWFEYCSTKNNCVPLALISCCLENTAINERISNLTNAFDALSRVFTPLPLTEDKDKFNEWVKQSCDAILSLPFKFAVSRDRLTGVLKQLNVNSLGARLKDFVLQNKSAISKKLNDNNVKDCISYICNVRNGVSHGDEPNLFKLPTGFTLFDMFNLLYKTDLLLVEQYILNE